MRTDGRRAMRWFATRNQDSLNVGGASRILPPEIEAQEVDRAMGQYPEQRAAIDIDFGDAGHAWTPPGFVFAVHGAAHEENVAFVFDGGGGFELRDMDWEFELRLSDERDFTL